MDLNDEKLVAIDSYIKEKLSSDGYNHSRGVMERAIEYANIHGGNEQYAAYAGLIHDVAKEVPKTQRVLLAEELGISLDNIEKSETALIHSKIGAYIAKKNFNLPEEVCEAVKTHTTGSTDMTLLQKIVYLADYTSKDRTHPGAKEVYEIAKKNLDEAMISTLKRTINFVLERDRLVHPKTIDAYNYMILNNKEKRD